MTSRNFFFPDWTRFWRVWSWLNGLHYSSFFVYGNLQQSALFGKFFLFDGNGTQVSFFENSAWTMTKALCLNAMAPEAFYSFFWLLYFYHDFSKNVSEISGQYFYHQIFCIKRWVLRRPLAVDLAWGIAIVLSSRLYVSPCKVYLPLVFLRVCSFLFHLFIFDHLLFCLLCWEQQ